MTNLTRRQVAYHALQLRYLLGAEQNEMIYQTILRVQYKAEQ